MEGIIHLIDYDSINGGFVPLSTQQHGACLFHAFRQCITRPREFTNTHLRCMLVSFVCNRVEELYPMLECSISGNYGHIRLSPEEYRRKEASGQLTDQERQEFNEPGPFSITSYCEALLKSPKIRLLWRGTVFETPLYAVQGAHYCPGWRLPDWNKGQASEFCSQCQYHSRPHQ